MSAALRVEFALARESRTYDSYSATLLLVPSLTKQSPESVNWRLSMILISHAAELEAVRASACRAECASRVTALCPQMTSCSATNTIPQRDGVSR